MGGNIFPTLPMDLIEPRLKTLNGGNFIFIGGKEILKTCPQNLLNLYIPLTLFLLTSAPLLSRYSAMSRCPL